MNPILRNILALVAGFITANIVNIGIIQLGMNIVPLPEGMIPGDMDSLKEHIDVFEFKHYIFPFLAHAIGTLAGAFLTAKLAATHKLKLALAIGAIFLFFGIMMVVKIGGSMLFQACDILLAYIPMAWLGAKLAKA